MKNVIFIVFIGVIVLTSCNSRTTERESLKQAVSKFKDTLKPLEIVEFYPEAYSEIQIDSTLNSGFNVKVKAYSDMEEFVTFLNPKDGISYVQNYRYFKFDISVTYKEKSIYKKSFDRQLVNEKFGYHGDFDRKAPLYEFDKLAVLQSINVNDEYPTKGLVSIYISYYIPNSSRVAEHVMVINEEGNANFITLKTS